MPPLITFTWSPNKRPVLIRECLVWIPTGTPALLNKVLHWFSHSLQIRSGIIFKQVMIDSFRILSILTFGTVHLATVLMMQRLWKASVCTSLHPAVRITGFSDCAHCPEFQELENTTFRKLDLFPSSGEWGETPTLLGTLERANLRPCYSSGN
jgi:hypothetical protein